MMKKLKLYVSPMQKKLLFRIVPFLVIAAFAWIIFAPHFGVLAYLQKHARLKKIEEKTIQLEEGNKSLVQEIDRLKNDPAYLEEVARREQGLLKKNEYIYDFSQKSKQD